MTHRMRVLWPDCSSGTEPLAGVDGSRAVSEVERGGERFQGRHAAEIASRLKGA